MRYFALIATLVVAACGGSVPQPIFDKEGISVSQLNRDRAECQDTYSGFNPMLKVIKCMEGRGYKRIGWM